MISKVKIVFLFLVVILPFTTNAQLSSIRGKVVANDEALEMVTVIIKENNRFTQSNSEGYYEFDSLEKESLTLVFRRVGYRPVEVNVEIVPGFNSIATIKLKEDLLNLNEVVISGSRYDYDRKESPVIVGVLNQRLLRANNSVTVADGLEFQPGLRMETNCQNCGFNQLRINGLDGAYTQILINNRAIFSSLNSVYGLEQIPSNIVDRIEIVKSGGSALYGSNAIAGTVNIITKEPLYDTWKVTSNLSSINGKSLDGNINFNTSIVDTELSKGLTVFGMKRERQAYDHNDDGFTEAPELSSLSLGTRSFIRPSKFSKLTFDLSYINENRRGGDQLSLAPEFTDITELLVHNTMFYGLEYEHYFDPKGKSSLISYISGQYTNRQSYYGGLGGGRTPEDSLLARNAYGETQDLANVFGTQYNYSYNSGNQLLIGLEQRISMVEDNIEGYDRLIDQEVYNTGLFTQFEWKVGSKLKLLNGIRFDYTRVQSVNELSSFTRVQAKDFYNLSPRLTGLYDLSPNLKFRMSWARGFRAPQAFNEDLHISSVAGEPRFVILGSDLKKETSDAFTTSLNLVSKERGIQYDLLFEAFYTLLKDPFTIVNTGSQLENGSIIEELQNGTGANVRGINIEANLSPGSTFQLQNGITIQESSYENQQIIFSPDGPDSEDVKTDEFLRNPSVYGYSVAIYKPKEQFEIDLSANYTGSMFVSKIDGISGDFLLRETDPFFDANLKLSYHIDLKQNLILSFSGGVQNIFQSYQNDLDSGALRDSNYVYGPSLPRTFFLSISLSNAH